MAKSSTATAMNTMSSCASHMTSPIILDGIVEALSTFIAQSYGPHMSFYIRPCSIPLARFTSSDKYPLTLFPLPYAQLAVRQVLLALDYLPPLARLRAYRYV